MVLGDLCCLGGFVKPLLCPGLEDLREQCGGQFQEGHHLASKGRVVGRSLGHVSVRGHYRGSPGRRNTEDALLGSMEVLEACIWTGCSGDGLNLPCSEGQIGMEVQGIL